MGREKGQRVKGNLKPASSGRVAELLSNQNTQISFSSLSAAAAAGGPAAGAPTAPAAFVPIIPDSDETGLDPQLTLTLRKLGKKDPTTKIKALQELLDLCKESESKVPEQILPYWPRIYTRLAIDEDKKVRELCHNLLACISTGVGRKLAPFTKVLLPTWEISKSDTFPPAASAARNSFQITFPTQEKQIQAIKFCSNELTTLLGERILSNFVAPDEELGVVSCLDTIDRLVRLEVEFSDGFLEEQLLKSEKFWEYGVHESSLVRRKFYTLLATLSQKQHGPKIPKSKLTKSLSHAFKEETVEIQSLWSSFLVLTLNGVFVDLSMARKQLLVCCRKGFYGNASQLGPLVLPLVHKIGAVGEGSSDDIFDALAEGFKNERSINERQSILRSYAELLAYEYSKSGSVPKSIFPFITSQLKQITEFGKTLNTLVKDDKFYIHLGDYCLENPNGILQHPEFGSFLLSFLQTSSSRVKGVQFDGGDKKSSEANRYNQLPANKQNLVQRLCHKLAELRNYEAFSTISRWLDEDGSIFYTQLIQNPQNDIENLFIFDSPTQKLEALRISIELLRAFPNVPATLSLFSSVFDKFFNQTQSDLELFIREIEENDNDLQIKPLKNWLRMNRFNPEISSESSIILKYLLKRGTQIFESDLISQKIIYLSENCAENTQIIQQLMEMESTSGSADLAPVYLSVWNAFLHSPLDLKLETLAFSIYENGLVGRTQIIQNLSTAAEFSPDLETLNSLVQHIGSKIFHQNEFQVTPISFEIDSDLLTFLGFQFPKIKNEHLGPMQTLQIDRHVKSVLYQTKMSLELEETAENLVPVAMNLFYLKALIDIYQETQRGSVALKNYQKNEQELFEEVNVLTTRVLEIIAGSGVPQNWKLLNEKMFQIGGDVLWDSKYPLELFINFVTKMDLPINNFSHQSEPENLEEIEKVFKNYLILQANAIGNLVELLKKERNEKPNQFYFDTLYSHVPEADKKRLMSLLELTMELISRDQEFLSIGTCWISAWLKQSKNIQTGNKWSYLWTLKLSRAVILIHELSKVNLNFTQEYIEFHAPNLYPIIYSHFIQCLETEEPWILLVAQNVAQAISSIPSPTLNFIEPKPEEIFAKFTPSLQKPQLFFKIASYKLMRKISSLQNEIIPKEFEIYFKRLKRAQYTDELILSFLLAWDALLWAQPNAYELANYVKEDYLLPNLLNLVFFTLLPEDQPIKSSYFENDIQLVPNEVPNMTHLACTVLQHVLRTLPYTVRWWWTSCLSKQRDKAHVEKIVTKYLSAKLAAEELGKVSWKEGDGDNVTVNCHPGCNELIARYKIEDTNLILTITLPLNHPLGPVTIKISDKKLHARISSLLNTRSHSLAAGLQLWKESLDSVYKDVDECAICFFIVHNSTKALPKLACKTCKKKFHSACLYKWFSTSNKSECPLCRTLF